jgi:hypothetical protein
MSSSGRRLPRSETTRKISVELFRDLSLALAFLQHDYIVRDYKVYIR